MELSLHLNSSCSSSSSPASSLHHTCERGQRVFVRPFNRPWASHNGYRFRSFSLKQPFQRYSRKHGLPHETICSSRKQSYPIQSSLYHEVDLSTTRNNRACNERRKLPRDVAVRSELAGTGSTAASYPLSEIWLNSKVRGILFYAVTICAAIVLFVPMLLQHPFVLVFDRYRRKSHYLIAKLWASLTVAPLVKIEYVGLDNFPSADTPAIYVSNHQSFLDIYTLLTLGRSFKFISKTSIFLYPIIGWAMFLLGAIPLKRLDSRSQLVCLKQCMALVKKGASVFFFPEGTRSKDGKLGPFKKGAFTVATKTGVPVIPITLIGTGDIMPVGMEGTLNPGSVKVIIHPPIVGDNSDALCTEARNIIAQGLISQS
ncbi:hypothetical protein ABFX02_11G033000 [Erythranthe guttata]